jgi:hypothetical protein
MLLFIVIALLVILTKSLIPPVATEAGFTFDAAVAIAGLFSFIGLFSYIFRPQRTTGKSFGWSRRGASVTEGHFETIDHLQQDIAVSPASRAIAGSSLVRRLVRAKDDPAKQRIRAQLSEIDDEGLFGLGLTSEDIAALRGTASPPAEAIIVAQVSPSIAGPLEPTDTPRVARRRSMVVPAKPDPATRLLRAGGYRSEPAGVTGQPSTIVLCYSARDRFWR